MFKNMTVGRKLAFGFGVVLVLLTLVGTVSFLGVTRMGTGAEDVITKHELIENLTQKEIDHLNWANQVVALFTDKNVTELSVQTDDHKCAFGQWLYGEGRVQAEKEIPDLAPIFKEIEGYHHQLHASAIEIGEHFHQADAKLPGILGMRMVDHLKWADSIRDAFLQKKTSLEVQTDPTRCVLGQWLATAEAQEAYKSAGPELKAAWDKMLTAHDELHASAIDICQHIGEGEQGLAQAKKVFDEKTVVLLHETLQHLGDMKTAADQAVTGMNTSRGIFVTKTKPCLKDVQELLDKAIGRVGKVVDVTNQSILSSARSTKASVTILSILASIIGVLAAVLIARSIIASLKQIIRNLHEGSEQVAAASSQVAAASQSLAEGATEQAAGLEETSSSLEEMSSMTRQNADNAQQANTLAIEARSGATAGAKSMTRMSRAIEEIQKSSDETSKIIKVIDEIAFQTNLLALNAAVEAARAGEAGKGFAVVAEEVRNLAMRSAEAAKNTSSMIEGSVKSARNGVDIAAEVSGVLDQIVQSVGKTTDLVAEISAASQEQAQGIDQINRAVSEMDKVTQQNAAGAEESSSASNSLQAQAIQMRQVVTKLTQIVGGDKKNRAQEKKKSHDSVVDERKEFSVSDHTLHEIACGVSKSESWEDF